MSLADQYREKMLKAMEADPAVLELDVFGPEALRKLLVEHDADGAMFLDSLASVIPVISEGVLTALEEIDALKGSV